MNPTRPPSSSRDLAQEFACLVGLDALDGAEASAMEHCHECPLGLAARAAMGYDETLAEMTAASYPPIAPPAALKDAIFSKISPKETSAPSKQGYFFLGDQEGTWTDLPGGKVRVKILSDLEDSPHTLVLLEADPGGVFFPHAHKGMEEVFMISGDLETEGHHMHAGDYLRAAPGTRHHRAISHGGCRAIMVTARENHPRRAIGLYAGLVRSLRSLRRR
ncbi:anti-sigma factor ChrR (cupin superfamily) [Haloferula luteola]|uniref:Anti-sigma factor ChrR (Cupin superfamily) n=1 Tax=Haloferula luteola TaxID=595692 RepID=A0A840V4X3_9BACT|nr:cupin domain-containing protein [Haloferula luteola]MBB5350684.1 anti-sigma factor ChrR (cupin superfamily) [Haloferula luteola]